MASVCRVGSRRLAGWFPQKASKILGVLGVFGQQLSMGCLGFAGTCLGARCASGLSGRYEYSGAEEGGSWRPMKHLRAAKLLVCVPRRTDIARVSRYI